MSETENLSSLTEAEEGFSAAEDWINMCMGLAVDIQNIDYESGSDDANYFYRRYSNGIFVEVFLD